MVTLKVSANINLPRYGGSEGRRGDFSKSEEGGVEFRWKDFLILGSWSMRRLGIRNLFNPNVSNGIRLAGSRQMHFC
jgi:hypothetical protein